MLVRSLRHDTGPGHKRVFVYLSSTRISGGSGFAPVVLSFYARWQETPTQKRTDLGATCYVCLARRGRHGNHIQGVTPLRSGCQSGGNCLALARFENRSFLGRWSPGRPDGWKSRCRQTSFRFSKRSHVGHIRCVFAIPWLEGSRLCSLANRSPE